MSRFTLVLILALAAPAADWPEWRGRGRIGVWSESGILERFPESGLAVKWRAPVRNGYSGPAVANGRVFLTDFLAVRGRKGTERAMALDEMTGRVLWTREWDADYAGLSYALGPRATPTVDNDRVYVLGAMGALLCLQAATGEIVWSKDYVRDYKTSVPTWGITASPLVDGERLIALVGGEGRAKVVSFDKRSGRELWRALDSDSEPGYSQPLMVDAAGRRQLIIWHPRAIASLDAATGATNWEQPFVVKLGMSVSTPVVSGSRLLVSAFYNGSMMLELGREAPGMRLLWKSKSDSEIETDTLHALVNTPVIDGEYVYGICSYGQMRCLKAATGERVWESLAATGEKARWSTGFMVRHGDRFFINNDRGELIIARLSPAGYQELSRTRLIEPSTRDGIGRRAAGAVNWSHPAYANRHIFARNDNEILSASLAAK